MNEPTDQKVTATPGKPDCYKCAFRRPLPGDTHSRCLNRTKGITVQGHPHGVESGWFHWPHNFDPTWLVDCNGWAAIGSVNVIDVPDPFGEILGILGKRL